jgi:hypothetical protein
VWEPWPQRRVTESPAGHIPTLLDRGILTH